MDALLLNIIEQAARKAGMLNRQDYELSSQFYVLVNDGSQSANLSSTDDSVRFNIFNGLDGDGDPNPVKSLSFDLEKNLLFVYDFSAYFVDFSSYLEIRSKERPIRFDHLENAHVEPSNFADEYALRSDLISMHTGRTEIRADFRQSNICRASISAVLLKPLKPELLKR